jgi:WD40 repeat protein
MSRGVTVRLTGCLSDKSVTGSVHGGKVTALAVVAESLVSVGFDDTLRFTRLDSTVMESDSVTLNGQPWCLSALPGGGGASSIFAVATSNEVALFSGRSRVTGILLPNDKFSCNCVALASEAEVILGCSDFKTRVFSIGEDKTLTLTATIETRSAVTALALHPSCDFLAVGDNGRQVEVYERGSWVERVKAIWAFHTSKVNCLAWSPSGNYLASGSVDECIIIWDFINPSKKLILPYAHSAGVSSLVWIDDTKLVSVGNDHVIVTWAIPSTL